MDETFALVYARGPGARRPACFGDRWPSAASHRRASVTVSLDGPQRHAERASDGPSSVGTIVTMISAASRVSG